MFGKSPEKKSMLDGLKLEKRLQKELRSLMKEPPPGMTVDLSGASQNLMQWTIQMDGAPGTLYEGEKFELLFKFSAKYPFDSPEVTFQGPNIPVHPHVYSNGHICLSILTDDWSPALSVQSVCLSIISMLSSCKEKKRPPDNSFYVKTCNKNPKKTKWWYHDSILDDGRQAGGDLPAGNSSIMSKEEVNTEKIVFKKKTIRNRRKSFNHSDDEEEQEENVLSKLEATKEVQKLRSRPHGVSIVGLALGRKVADDEEEINVRDPFKTKTGGMVNMKNLKSGKIKKVDDAYETGIGTQFSAETNKRDEDEEMMKYIEEQLSKKKGISKGKKEEKREGEESKYCSPEEAALQAVPTHLRVSSTQRSEEMLSHQMLSGIPEVDLGIDAKIRNIEATEEAKLKLLRSKLNKKEGPSQFVPSNITVNFMQQNRINSDDSEPVRKKGKNSQKVTVLIAGDNKHPQKRKEGEKATDDYHYEKFKKQFRRY